MAINERDNDALGQGSQIEKAHRQILRTIRSPTANVTSDIRAEATGREQHTPDIPRHSTHHNMAFIEELFDMADSIQDVEEMIKLCTEIEFQDSTKLPHTVEDLDRIASSMLPLLEDCFLITSLTLSSWFTTTIVCTSSAHTP